MPLHSALISAAVSSTAPLRSCHNRCSGRDCPPASSAPRSRSGPDVALQERLGRDQDAGGADAALQSAACSRNLLLHHDAAGRRWRHALDCVSTERPAASAPRTRQAHTKPPVEHDAAGPAVAGGAALLAAGQVEARRGARPGGSVRVSHRNSVAVAVDRRRYVVFRHLVRSSPVRSAVTGRAPRRARRPP